ncbi:MAG: hypothetical protein Q8918_02185 [Bacteroidota bacterium]|nr:hypothetical protein [Bacteroidota bacterium]MDP4212293.1 hypothetical protein [Bacteroidota bacterium]MDP4248900.1 hypothetical protein [Bacteroidota bacterium]
MRSILFTIPLMLATASLFAQDDVFSNKTNQALEKVIRDYPNRFHNIKGEMISQHANTTEYKSTIVVPGASSCTVSKYNISSSDTYSWSCTALHTKDFITARGKFKEIYEQIENTIIKVDGQKPFILSGQYRTPTEIRDRNTIAFELLPAVGDMKSLRIELSLEKDLASWKVKLHVYDGDKIESVAVAIQ